MGDLIREALGQSWGRKEILIAGPGETGMGWVDFGAAQEALRWVCLSEGRSARAVLVGSARGEWIQWLRPGERLASTKIEGQLREAGEPLDLLCSPYCLRGQEKAIVLDPRSEPLSSVARLGTDFPFTAPLLWSTVALRAFFRRPEGFYWGAEGREPFCLRFDWRIGFGTEAGCECPGAEGEPTRAEWRMTLAWALALASASREKGGAALGRERENLFSLLLEMDSSFARRAAERPGARDLLAEAAPKKGLAATVGRVAGPAAAFRAEAVMRRLREAERAIRQGRRRWLRKVGLRKKLVSMGPVEAKMEAYASWTAAYQRLDEADREAIQREIGRFPRRPLLSVVMPVFNTPERWLRRAIDSVREQLYPDWELCLADDGSRVAHIRALLEASREEDPRIRLVFRAESGGISAASNSALEHASGEWIVLLDHDDELPEEALYLVVREILRDPELRLLYSDEDLIDESGRRFGPYFKPDFSYDLLLSQNCINHLGVYHAGLLRSLGGFRSRYDGAQDYDLALRFAERLRPGQIRHIPHVLYHWRAHATSTATNVEAKPYGQEAARRAIEDHLEKAGSSAEVLQTPISWVRRVHWRAPANLRASVLLGARGDGEALQRSIQSIRSQTDFAAYELLMVVDRAGGPEAESGEREGIRLLLPAEELTGPPLWNWAARQAQGEVLVFLEAPVEVRGSGWLAELVSQAMRPPVGAAGARILAADGTVAEAGIVLGIEGAAGAAFRGWSSESIGYFGQAILARNPSAVSGSCLATRRALFEECGGFDEGYRRELWAIDYCLRLREKGYRVVFTPYAELVRMEDSREAPAEDQERFRTKWAEAIERDPAYNPNLSLERGGYGLAWPPRTRRPWRA